MDLDEWGEGLIEAVYEKWKSKYSFWKPGFKVFYSPVRKHPRVMIISRNPGGNEESFRREDLGRFERGDFSVPKVHEYVERKYRIAKKMRKLFEGQERMLDNSIAFTVLFFRSKDMRLWRKKIDRQTRKEMENFCYEKVREIMEKIRPKILLVIGVETYRKLKEHVLGKVDNEKSINGKNGRRISITARWNDIPVFCVPHMTGARITNSDFDKNRKIFFSIV